jgi:hypothetical protein
MWKDNYDNICELKESFGEKINTGASKSEINQFAIEAKNILGISLPDDLCNIYAITKGIEFNGHILYGIDSKYLNESPAQKIYGLIDMNLAWKEEGNDFDKYLFIAEHDLSWFVYDPTVQLYLELDFPSGTSVATYSSIESLLDVFFKRATQ